MCAHTMQMCNNSLHQSQHTNVSQCPVTGNYLGASTLFDRNHIYKCVFRNKFFTSKLNLSRHKIYLLRICGC